MEHVAGTPHTAPPILMGLVLGGMVGVLTGDVRYALAILAVYAAGAGLGWAIVRRRRRT